MQTIAKGSRLSLQQARLWSLQAQGQVYRALCVVEIEGMLDRWRLKDALQSMVMQYEILHTAFYCLPEMDLPVQVVTNSAELDYLDVNLENLGVEDYAAQIEAHVAIVLHKPFDLAKGLLLSTTLLRFSPHAHILILALPALSADTSTLKNFVQKLSQAYALSSQPQTSLEETLQYADVSAWQNDLLQEEEAQEFQAYWSKMDLSHLALMHLPLEKRAPQESSRSEQGFHPQIYSLPYQKEDWQQINTCAEKMSVSLESVLLTCWQVLLARYMTAQRIIVGVACDGRHYEELEDALGLYTRVVPISVAVEKERTMAQLLAYVHTSLEKAVQLQAYFSWDLLTEAGKIQPETGYFPLSFEYEIWPANTFGADVRFHLLQRRCCNERFHLKLSVLQIGEELRQEIHYDPTYFSATTIKQIAASFQTLLVHSLQQPDARIALLPIMEPEEQSYLQASFTGAQMPISTHPLHTLFEIQAERVPQQLAVVCGTQQLTYQELNTQANQLGHWLQAQGVGTGMFVGLCMDRCVEMLVGLLGILKSGAAYVPFDPLMPPARLAYQLHDIQASFVLTQKHLLAQLPEWSGHYVCLDQDAEQWSQQVSINPVKTSTVDDLAYVIYTSGSTGTPKGVMIRHQSIVNYTQSLLQMLQSESAWHYATVSTLAADLGNTAIFCALASGSCLHVLPLALVTDGHAFAQYISTHPIDVLKIVPSHLEALLAIVEGTRMFPRRFLILGGEAFPRTLLERIRQAEAPCVVFNHYGPTEITIGAIVNNLGVLRPDGNEMETGAVPIGRPIANTQVYLLDEEQNIVPVGVVGEIYLGGAGLAAGYFHQEELTRTRFIRWQTPQNTSMIIYRTGDAARYRADGSIEFVGRLDNQVKIRGYRVELGEIEAVLGRHENIRSSVVVMREEVGKEPQLVAYLIPWQQPAASSESLRQFLQTYLPAYMLPAAFVVLQNIPLTPNGKVDRRQLPMPDESEQARLVSFVGARSPVEEMLVEIWEDVLAVKPVGIYANFFRLGGHSLLATQMISRLRQTFGVELSITSLFEAATVAELAERIEQAFQHEQRETAPPIVPVPRTEMLPLSFAQQRLWFLDQLEPESTSYNKPIVLQLKGTLNVKALEQSFAEVMQRHENLRTTFRVVDGLPTQVIAPRGFFKFLTGDVSALTPELREKEIQRLIKEDTLSPFELSSGPLLRITLLRVRKQEHILLTTMHHIVSDGWSNGVFIRELAALYTAFTKGKASPLAPLPIQYADFAVWQRQWMQGAVLQAQLMYWKEQLQGATALELPTDYPRSAVATGRAITHPIEIPPMLSEQLKALSRQENVTLFMTLLAAFQIVLSRYSGQNDISIGSAIANRNRREVEGLIGFFVNTLVLRTDLSGNPSFKVLLERVRKVALGAYTHQDIPFEKLVEELQPERRLNQNPFFQVSFIVHNTPSSTLKLPNLLLDYLPVTEGVTHFDLELHFWDEQESLSGLFIYNSTLFESATIARMANHFLTLLEGIVNDPTQCLATLPLLTAQERQQLLLEWNQTDAVYSDQPIHKVFEQQAAEHPDVLALVFEDQFLTYGALNQYANQLAHYLHSLGIGSSLLVGICMERSFELIIGLLGILKVGGAYVPLDPSYPEQRLAFILADAQVSVVLTQERFSTSIPHLGQQNICLDRIWQQLGAERATNPENAVDRTHAAYVIYTSGSTGNPKGVMVSHRHVMNFFAGMDVHIGRDVPGIWLAVTSVSFDISVLELFWTLLRGFRVIIQARLDEAQPTQEPPPIDAQMDFSLFYFANDEGDTTEDKYKLLLEGAKFADQHGFSAVWTPERHFNAFGGLYPNPSITSAAIAALTEHIQIRAGSVVLPLHNPIRVVEEWSVVDNISKGRVGLSFASGWHANDFVLAPENYAKRKDSMFREVETVRKLWRGEAIAFQSGTGNMVDIKTFPRPLQAELPIWITSGGSADTFRMAGEIGANLLTHLLGQDIDELAEKIAIYRDAWQKHGHGAHGKAGYVSLMLHTYVGTDKDLVRETVRKPFSEYLKSSIGLLQTLAQSLGMDISAKDFSEDDMEVLLSHAFDRYFESSGLFGTVDSCLSMIQRLKAIGVDEVACLIDFGVKTESVLSSFQHLYQLTKLCNVKPDIQQEDYSVAAQIVRHDVTHLQCTPSLAKMLLLLPDTADALQKVQLLLLGGEALPLSLVEHLHEMTGAELHNMYGPTETTIWSTANLVEKNARIISIGQPIANTQIYLLDAVHLQPVPIGVTGDLYIGGEGVAYGYLNRVDLTAERFIPDMYGAKPGARIYKTGDNARYMPDGKIEYLGRSDQQIKVRGYRIELGEIEAVLEQYSGLREAVVVAHENGSGDSFLVAYVVAQRGVMLSADELRADLKRKLPSPMIPAHFVQLEALPLTPNGKVDRRALPAPELLNRETNRAMVTARTPIEELIAGIWREMLRLPQVGIYDNFFESGGHSLGATQVISRLRNVFQVELPLRSLFEAPTIAGLAERIEQALRNEQQEGREALPLLPVARDQDLPLSFAQQRLWFLSQLEPEDVTYSVLSPVRMRGALVLQALEYSLHEIVLRHESLRTTFQTYEGLPVQRIAAQSTVRLYISDLSGLTSQEQEFAVRQLAQEEAMRPFDLSVGPLLRCTLLRQQDAEHVLLLSMHHIVSDGWSRILLVRELSALYIAFVNKQPSPLPALPIQYADFAVWQRRWLQGEVLERQVQYWREHLAAVPPLELPTDYPRPAQQSFRGARQSLLLPLTLQEQLKALSQREGVTLFMTLLAAFQVLLARYSGQSDLAIGTPIANRTHAEVEGLIGFFVNTLVLRSDLSGDPTFVQVLKRVREVALGAYAHQDVPFEKIVEDLQPERDLSRSPLFQVMFVLQISSAFSDSGSAGIELTELDSEIYTTAKFDLTLQVTEQSQGLHCVLEYTPDLFAATTITRLLACWHRLLEGIMAAPQSHVSDLPLLTPADRQALLVDWNATQTPLPRGVGVHTLIAAQAQRTPDAVALVFEEQQVTYDQLETQSNQLAQHLRQLAVGPEVLVGVYLERSLWMLVSVLAILKAGGAYVPLDPSWPRERLAFVLQQIQAPLVLTQPSFLAHLPEQSTCLGLCVASCWPQIAQQPSTAPEVPVQAEQLAYVIYTSGTSGQPKGVMIPHQSLLNYVCWSAQHYRAGQGSGSVLHTALAFDLTVTSLFLPLLVGGSVVLVREGPGVEELAQILRQRQHLSLVKLTPAHLALVQQSLSEQELAHAAHALVIGGEALQEEHLRLWRRAAPATRLLNEYGPTETVVGCSLYEVPGQGEVQGAIPIGTPIANSRLYVLDEHWQLVPVGARGEIYIGGRGVGRGYVQRPEETGACFIPDSYSGLAGERLYRTGDLGRYREDGTLVYLGRKDQQVKLRGYRIELEEIEAVVKQQEGVQDCLVLLREERAGSPYLVAYVIAQESADLSSEELRRGVQARVPEYMVPSSFVVLDAFPLTSNGKVDRRALPSAEVFPAGESERISAGRSVTEELVGQIWSGVLGRTVPGLHENFFTLGGHSLLASQVVSRVRSVFAIEVPLRSIFEAPTLSEFCQRIEQAQRHPVARMLPALHVASREEALPLSFAQQRLWFLNQLEPESSAYSIVVAVRLQGPVVVSALQWSINEVIRRHESLRTVFPSREGVPVQWILPWHASSLPAIDLSGLQDRAQHEEAKQLVHEATRVAFDLEQGPLLRSFLLRLKPDEHVFVLTMHHIISDGWSMQILMRELTSLYAARVQQRSSPLAPLPIQYADFALWQRQWLQGEVLDEQLAYWTKQLSDITPLELPYDYPRPAIARHNGANYSFVLSNELSRALMALCQQENVTLFMLLLAAFQVLLHHYANRADIAVGTDSANRNREETEGLIGFFINLLVLRINLSDKPSFRQMLGRIRGIVLDAYTHQDTPFELLVERLDPDYSLDRMPLVQILFVLQNIPSAHTMMSDLIVEPLNSEILSAKFDLALFMYEGPEGLQGSLTYNTDLFKAATVKKMMDRFEVLLQNIVAQPDAPVNTLEIYSEEEKASRSAKKRDRLLSQRQKLKNIKEEPNK